MKKIIFILITLAMIFVVFSCDEPKGTENTESTQTGTTSDNNTNTDTDNTTTDNNTDTDNKDYIIQNPYEELEKTLTIKINSIDEVEFSDGEWEFYNYWDIDEGDDIHHIEELKGIATIQNNAILIKYNYIRRIMEYYNADSYAEDKEYYSDREGVTFDDKNKIISFAVAIPEDKIHNKEEFLDDMSFYFHESTKEETDEYVESYTYSVTTNSEKNAYSFFSNEKYTDKIYNESGEYIIKYIFKKIK